MRVLCAADVHIGRRSSRLPDHVDAREHSCARAWEALVDLAIDQDVDVVAIAGDLVDKDNKFFEAIGPLERGLRRLAEAGIDTVAVAGNHDHDVLPQLERALAGQRFRLLGRHGTWRRYTIERRGERLHVDGWSFPKEHVGLSPLSTYALSPDETGPTLGLLHADLDARSSYAPVPLADLRARPVSLWLLGHIHTASRHDGAVPVLYPGSPQAMHPGETGPHGVVIADLQAGRPVKLREVPLSSVRYDAIEIDLSGVTGHDDVRTDVAERLRTGAAALIADQERLRHLCLRVSVTGTTAAHADLAARLHGLREELELDFGGVIARVESLSIETRPPMNLEELKDRRDATGVLARLILDLDQPEAPTYVRELLGKASQSAMRVRQAKPYLELVNDDTGLDPAALRATLRVKATGLLGQLLSQREVMA